jgi:ornithine cyclodeaminase
VGGISIIGREAIEAAASRLALVPLMEAAFAAYSQGRAQVSAVGELLFAQPPGEAHIKAAGAVGAGRFVVKVATGFYDNPKAGLPSSSGLMLLFDAATGAPTAILLDEGRLTDLRTAAAGATAAKWLAPAEVPAIAVLGAGVQARLQLAALREVTACRKVWLWARRREAVDELADAARGLGFEARIAATPAEAAAGARLIVTTTPAARPLLDAGAVQPGTLIVAVGSDTPQKGELADDLIARAGRLVADSRLQARQRGELRRAPAGAAVAELGEIVAAGVPSPTGPGDITLCDLTGVATQDLAIAEAVADALSEASA